jgi:predicted GH43/DUF377 family glycosyl hydrolase
MSISLAGSPSARRGLAHGFLRHAALSLFALFVLCTPARAQVTWQRFDANPIIPNFVSGGYAIDPVVLYDASARLYRMWFTAKQYGGPWSIYYAISSDGTTWFSYVNNPVLQGGSAAFESDGVVYAGIVYNGSQYKMLYEGVQNGFANAVGLATSSDGIEWTKSSSNPVLSADPAGWDSVRVGVSEAVHFDGSTYSLYYAGWNGSSTQVGLATSVDAVHWTRNSSGPVITAGAPGSWDEADVEPRGMMVHGGLLYLFYTAQAPGAPRAAIGLATSTDGVTWAKYGGNPVLTGGGPASWDWTVRGGWPQVDGSTVRLWYAGTPRDATQWSIGYATSPLVTLGVGDSLAGAPHAFVLAANFPNPVRTSTTFAFDVPSAGRVTLEVMDVMGRTVATLADEEEPPGRYMRTWNASAQPSGIYLARLRARGFQQVRRVVLTR